MNTQLPKRFILTVSNLLMVVCVLTTIMVQVAWAAAPSLITLDEFAASVRNGQSDVARGVYVADAFALPIEQQPAGDAGFVTDNPNAVSQFQGAAQLGVTGLLAHNTLAGAEFSQLQLGQEVSVVYGDGAIRRYTITGLHRFQAIEPSNSQSNFVDLTTGTHYTANEVFQQIYAGGEHVTFQTCIEQADEVIWGRLFVIATPIA